MYLIHIIRDYRIFIALALILCQPGTTLLSGQYYNPDALLTSGPALSEASESSSGVLLVFRSNTLTQVLLSGSHCSNETSLPLVLIGLQVIQSEPSEGSSV